MLDPSNAAVLQGKLENFITDHQPMLEGATWWSVAVPWEYEHGSTTWGMGLPACPSWPSAPAGPDRRADFGVSKGASDQACMICCLVKMRLVQACVSCPAAGLGSPGKLMNAVVVWLMQLACMLQGHAVHAECIRVQARMCTTATHSQALGPLHEGAWARYHSWKVLIAGDFRR